MITLITLLKQFSPFFGAAAGEGGEIVLNLEQGLAPFALIDDGIERVSASTFRFDALEPGAIHVEV